MKETEITKKVRKAVLERDSFDGCPCCRYCGKPVPIGAHLHHVMRRSHGGKGSLENLVTLCAECHSALHNGHSEIQERCVELLTELYGEDQDV